MADTSVGAERRFRQPSSLSAAERAEIARRYTAGEPVAPIAATFGISEGTVSNVARAEGCAPRQVRGKVARTADFDPAKLAVVEWEGEARVVDTVLGAALGYERPRTLHDLIARKRLLFGEAGVLPSRSVKLYTPEGGRPTVEYLLNREQVNLAILLCGLPNVDAVKAHIAKVFTAWEDGRLTARDLHTAVDLQESREAAAVAAPDMAAIANGFDVIKAEIPAKVRALLEPDIVRLLEVVQSISASISAPNVVNRRELSEATRREHIATVERFFDGRCPCCKSVDIVRNGQKLSSAAFDHKTGNRAKAGPHETWLVCSPCNAAFERPEYDQRKRDVLFAAFQVHREELAQQQLRLI